MEHREDWGKRDQVKIGRKPGHTFAQSLVGRKKNYGEARVGVGVSLGCAVLQGRQKQGKKEKRWETLKQHYGGRSKAVTYTKKTKKRATA